MSRRLEGKTAMVVGAGSIGPGWGNGKATAALFAREGARVLCVDIDEGAARETAELIRREGGEAEAYRADASDAADVAGAVATCVERFGGLDVLDNNVGILVPGGVVELTEDQWDRVMAVNLKSCFLAMKHAIPVMERAGGGAIVNISSIASIRFTGRSSATYYASKAALNHLTSTTAIEYARKGIRINTILPGLMHTPMVESLLAAADAEATLRAQAERCPMGRLGDAWDVAHAALFLVSDEAKYITGVVLPVDGGVTVQSA
jgi:NAD(P)-dependent dehydrogenase (short-subunit alcohol dehydrogenase family)